MRLYRALPFGLVLASVVACTGSDPVPCSGAACEAPDSGKPVEGFELAAADTITVKSGTVVEIDVTITRGGYAGAIAVTAEDLPPNVSAGALTIAPGGTTGKLTLTALPAALHGKKAIKLVAIDVNATLRRERPASLLVRGEIGALDNSFGTQGRTDVGGGVGGLALAAMVVQDKAILLGGTSEKNFTIARVGEDGKVDEAFGNAAGRAVANLRTEEGTDELARAMAVGPSGSIVIGGYGIPLAPPSELEVARFDAAGKLDAAFDGDGIFAKAYSGEAVAPEKVVELEFPGLAVTAEGKTYVGGFVAENKLLPDFVRHAVLARLDKNGGLDLAFGGGDGWTSHVGSTESSDSCLAVATAGDKVICAGATIKSGATEKSFFVWRHNADGTEDTTFGMGGVSPIAYAPNNVVGEAQAVHALADGKVVVTGINGNKAVVIRLDATGKLDAAFNAGAPLVVEALGALDFPVVRSAVDAQGRVLVVGSNGADRDIAIVRVNDNGTIDATFGQAGRAIIKVGLKAGDKGNGYTPRVALPADGRILVATTLEGQGPVVFRLWE